MTACACHSGPCEGKHGERLWCRVRAVQLRGTEERGGFKCRSSLNFRLKCHVISVHILGVSLSQQTLEMSLPLRRLESFTRLLTVLRNLF